MNKIKVLNLHNSNNNVGHNSYNWALTGIKFEKPICVSLGWAAKMFLHCTFDLGLFAMFPHFLGIQISNPLMKFHVIPNGFLLKFLL